MTNEELIARLRELASFERGVGVMQDFYCSEEMIAAADRIEALVNKAALLKAAYEGFSSLVLSVQQDCIKERQRAERLEALLREARRDLEHYVTHEYPKHLHPYYERQWNRDMELCRRIDAALTTEADNG